MKKNLLSILVFSAIASTALAGESAMVLPSESGALSIHAASAAELTLGNLTLSVAEGEVIDEEDGTFKVALAYTAENTDDHPLASGTVYYSVTSEEGFSASNSIDIDLTAGSRNIYVSGLAYSTEYTLTVTSVSVDEFNMETFDTDHLMDITDNLPSVKFTTNTPTAIQSNKSLSSAASVSKYISNGNIVIQQGKKIYNISGTLAR